MLPEILELPPDRKKNLQTIRSLHRKKLPQIIQPPDREKLPGTILLPHRKKNLQTVLPLLRKALPQTVLPPGRKRMRKQVLSSLQTRRKPQNPSRLPIKTKSCATKEEDTAAPS